MYDGFSLMKLSNRLALEGEELVAHKFRNGSMGLVSRSDFESWWTRSDTSQTGASLTAVQPRRNFWESLKDSLLAFLMYYGLLGIGTSCSEPGPVVAIPSEALVRVFGISDDLQRLHHLRSTEDALFTKCAPPVDFCREALYFGNGVMVPLQRLHEGQRIKVLRRSWAESIEPSPQPVYVNA